MNRIAKADMTPVRQRTQYTCVPASLAMCLRALGHDVTEDIVNKVMGAAPMKGARWEEVLAAAQHFGCRATLTMPSTVEQLKAWTDAGTPVMIAWNPEGRPWSHASAVFDVEEREDGLYVHVADPNMPNPKKTVRVVSEDDFYGKWYEKTSDYLVRRPAVAIEREITSEGAQVNILSGEEALPFATKLLASRTASQAVDPSDRLADRWIEARAKRKNKPLSQKDKMKVDKTPDKLRSAPAKALAERGGTGAGKHKNKQDFDRGQSRKPKHKKPWTEREAASANWRDWVRQTPGAEDPDGPVVMALSELLQVVQNEGLEAVNPKDALGMLAWDWGWSNQGLPRDRRHFANVLAKPLRVDLRKEHAKGLKAGSEDRVASRYAASKPYCASTGLDCRFWKATDDGQWYMALESWHNRNEYDNYGPFRSFNEAKKFLDQNFANPGGFSKFDNSKWPAPRNPINPKGNRRWAAYSGNPDGKPIYDVKVDHGDTGEPLAGGTDIMRRVQNKLLEEQGNPKRPRSPEASLRLSADRGTGADRIAAAWLGESE